MCLYKAWVKLYKLVKVLNPSATGGADVYGYVISELDSAIADFSNAGSSRPQYDFYYNGNASNWIKAANSLKKKSIFKY